MARSRANRRYLLAAVLIAGLLWLMAQGSSSVERGFDVPVVFRNVPDSLVLTEQNSDVVNVRLLGSRAVLRNLDVARMEYVVDASRARRGEAEFEVDVSSQLDLPRGARVVSRSPSRLEVKFEQRGTKVMRVRADVEGEPAAGFALAGVEVEPPRVRLSGARREVQRLNEVVTEPIDVAGLHETTEREVRLALGGANVWLDEPTTVRVRIRIEAVPGAEGAGRAGGAGR